MAPIKFEQNIREKLQERELQPNKDSWNQLSKKLGHAPAPKNNRRVWMAVAAGFMGLLIVVSYVLTSGNDNQRVELVEENIVTPIEDIEMIKAPNFEDKRMDEMPIVASENDTDEVPIDNAIKENNNYPIPQKNVAATKKIKIDTPFKIDIKEPILVVEHPRIAKNDKKSDVLKNEKSEHNKEALFVDTKVSAVVAAVRQMEASNNAVTAEEIDALLDKAQRDIATNRMLASSNKKIDPSALLQDVETEMERSFRDKVFEALGEGYNKVRTAVVERNN